MKLNKILQPTRFSIPLIFLLLCSITVQAQINGRSFQSQIFPQGKEKTQTRTESIYFEENRGQFDSRVRFKAMQTSGYTLFLTEREAVYVLTKGEAKTKDENGLLKSSQSATAVFLRFAENNSIPIANGLFERTHRTNHFMGNNPEKWKTNIPNYGQVQITNIFQGVDVLWNGSENPTAGFDLILKTNANLNQIVFQIEGAEQVSVNDQNELEIKTKSGTIKQKAPNIYRETENGLQQKTRSIFRVTETFDSQSRSSGKSFSISLKNGGYGDSPKQIPSLAKKYLNKQNQLGAGNLSNLAYSTFLGGGLSEISLYGDLAVDSGGNAYLIGQTNSVDFPSTPGSFDPTLDAINGAVITKVSPDGSSLIYSTFLHGGNGGTVGQAIAVDSTGSVYVTGIYQSRNGLRKIMQAEITGQKAF